jgi:prepilin-type N-terminal cleavage/methylation domain-containing protein
MVIYSSIRTRAFSLIEMLVVIAVISVLIGILVPSLSGARKTARLLVETAAGRSSGEALALYANDYKSAILPGYPPAKWVAGGQVVDRTGAVITGPSAQRYPWRLLPVLEYNLPALYKDKRVLSAILDQGPDAEYLISLYPSLGMNVAFVGGSVNHLGFDPAMAGTFGRFYLTRIESATRPSQLIAFASARAKEPSGMNLGRPDGYFLVEAPLWGSGWQATYDPDAPEPGTNSGHLGLRHAGKGVVSLLDGHADTLSWEQLKDMRRWADGADAPDWKLKPLK